MNSRRQSSKKLLGSSQAELYPVGRYNLDDQPPTATVVISTMTGSYPDVHQLSNFGVPPLYGDVRS